MRQPKGELRVSRRLISALFLRKADTHTEWDKWKTLYVAVVTLWLISMWVT